MLGICNINCIQSYVHECLTKIKIMSCANNLMMDVRLTKIIQYNLIVDYLDYTIYPRQVMKILDCEDNTLFDGAGKL